MPGKQPLQTVIDHLRQIAAATAASGNDVKEKRRLVDTYFAANPGTQRHNGHHIALSGEPVAGEWVVTTNCDSTKRILYIHGGSWVAGSVQAYRPHVARIAEATGCAVLSANYPLAPEHPFPAGLDSCVEAYCWMLQNGPKDETPAQSVAIIGDSAGGNLTLATLLAIKEKGLQLPDAAVALSPATDLRVTGESMTSRRQQDPVINPDVMPLLAKIYLQGGEPLDYPLASPLYGDLAGLPPLLIQTGEAEVLLDDSTRFAARAISQGVPTELEVWAGMPHVFQGFAPYLPEAEKALKKIGRFIKRHL